MNLPKGLNCSRAFIKKALNFSKFYTLTRKDPGQMILKTLNELVKLVNYGEESKLEPLSNKAQSIGNYLKPKELCQIEIIGEEDRFIIYRPTKLLQAESGGEEIAYIIDLLYIG